MPTPYWFLVIQNAKKRKAEGRKPFTIAHVLRAGEWTTCACGWQDPGIPRRLNGEPQDFRLMEYGMDFSRAVRKQDPGEALRILLLIEKRSAEILAEVTRGS